MERESPSPSLETAKPTLKERVGFLGRYLSRAVEQVPQRNSIYSSVEDKVTDYKKAFEWEHDGKTLDWLNTSIDEAYDGIRWSRSETSISIAKKYQGEKPVSSEEIRKIREIWGERAPELAERNMNYWLSEAQQEAYDGIKWSHSETSISIARDYAQIGNLELPQERVAQIRETWERNAPLKARQHAFYWIKQAGEEVAKGKDPSTSFSIAKDYQALAK